MKKNGLTTSANQKEEEPVLITSTGAIFEEFLPKESESGMSQMSTKEVCNALRSLLRPLFANEETIFST